MIELMGRIFSSSVYGLNMIRIWLGSLTALAAWTALNKVMEQQSVNKHVYSNSRFQIWFS